MNERAIREHRVSVLAAVRRAVVSIAPCARRSQPVRQSLP
jgi:hypothetical protein